MSGLRLGIPAYGYPGFGVWENLGAVQEGALVVMDPADGPGSAIDPRYVAAITAAVGQGLRVFGYVTADYGRRDGAAMVEELERYRAWYRPCGIFIDQTPASACSCSAILELVDHVRACGMSVAINPGQPDIDPQDAAVADHVVNFEGPHSTYRGTRFPAWVRELPAERFWHLVYEVVDARTMRAVVAAVARAHAGIAYISDMTMPNPWERLPAYWHEQRALLSPAAA